ARGGGLRAWALPPGVRGRGRPGVPTLREAGPAGAPAYLWLGLLAPAHTPAPVIDKLNAAVNEGLKAPEFGAAIAKLGLEPRSMTPQEFAAKLADEARDWEAAVRESGVTID